VNLTDPGVVAAIAQEFLGTPTPTPAQIDTIRTRLGKVEQGVASTSLDDVTAALTALAARFTEWRNAVDAPAKRAALVAGVAQLDRVARQLPLIRDRMTDAIRRIDDGNP
jgi:acyl-CoA reductase-like NAD-dependent aldehyde dehydrogenase